MSISKDLKNCPLCGGILGRIKVFPVTYYCHDCCRELQIKDDAINVFMIFNNGKRKCIGRVTENGG